MVKQMDASTGRWLNNKTWMSIIIVLVTAAFFLGGEITGNPDAEKRLSKVESLSAVQKEINKNIKETLTRLETSMNTGFAEIKEEIRLIKK